MTWYLSYWVWRGLSLKKGRAECADNFLVYASELLENETHFREMSHYKDTDYNYENRLLEEPLKLATLIEI